MGKQFFWWAPGSGRVHLNVTVDNGPSPTNICGDFIGLRKLNEVYGEGSEAAKLHGTKVTCAACLEKITGQKRPR